MNLTNPLHPLSSVNCHKVDKLMGYFVKGESKSITFVLLGAKLVQKITPEPIFLKRAGIDNLKEMIIPRLMSHSSVMAHNRPPPGGGCCQKETPTHVTKQAQL